MILGICENTDVLKVMNIVVTILKIIQIVVPIVLMFSLMFKMIGAMTKHDDDAIASLKKKAVPNIVAAVLIFIVPLLVGIIMNVTLPDSEYTKCIVGISSEKLQQAYEDKAERLVSKAEETLNINDYVNAMNYMPNVKDKDKRRSYEERLEILKVLIDEARKPEDDNINKDYGICKWEYYRAYSDNLKEYYSSPLAFSECIPEGALSSGDSLPLIIWLHGSGGDVYSAYVGGGLIKISEDWSETGLKNIPAILMAPQLDKDTNWGDTKALETIKAMIKFAKEKYNIDTDKVVLMGHSMGGSGVVSVAASNKDLFSSLVIMSGYSSGPGKNVSYFKMIPLRGYTEVLGNVDPNTGEKRKTGEIMKSFFKESGHLDDLTIYEGAKHGEIPKIAFTEDIDNDGISDLIYWALSQTRN